MKMTIAETLEVIEHAKDIVFHGHSIMHLIPNNIVGDYVQRHESVGKVTFIPLDAICEVEFKDYDLEVQDILEKQHELDKWIQKRIKK